MAREVIYTVCRSVYGPYESQKWYHKELFTVRKLHFISGTYNIFMAREVIYGLSIRTDRTDRKSDIRSVKNFLRSVNCISLWNLEYFHGKRGHIWFVQPCGPYESQKWYTVTILNFFLRRIHMMWTKFLLKLSRAFALFTRLIWRKRSFYELSWTGQNQMLFV